MKMRLQILSLIILTSLNLFGQNKLPRNLKQTVQYLEKDCSENIKAKIKTIHEDSLIFTVYPFAKNEPYKSYKTIFNWTSDANSNPKIIKYLEKKGISNYHSEILLYAFRQKLLRGKLNEKAILDKFREQQRKLDEKDQIKYVTDTINGVYIPKNLEDCFSQINSFWNDSTKTQVKNMKEEEFTGKMHLGFGMWMRNNWHLWGGSRLSKYFNDLGVYHPDDMSGIILDSYYRYLSNEEIKLEEQVKYYQDYWENSRKKELDRKQEEFSEYKIGDTLIFNYNKGYVSKEQEDKYDNNACIAKGMITGRNEKYFLIKVKIIETCDKKGIVYFDNDGHNTFNPKTRKWSAPSRRIIKKVKADKEQWFEYKDWEIIE
jgi:type II secretory pathway component PulJ